MDQFDSSTPWFSESVHEPVKEYGDRGFGPEEAVFYIQQNNHKHFFIRRDASTVTCRDCDIYWSANTLEMKIENGKVVEFKGQRIEEPIYS